MNAALALENVSKRYGSVLAVDNLSLQIETGTIFGLLGPNGSGKTTSLSICSTLLSPDSGDVFYDGVNIQSNLTVMRRALALMPQGRALDPFLCVEDNLRFYGKLIGVSRPELTRSMEEVIDRFGLEKFMRKNTLAISGGQFRRAQLARTFMGTPRYILLDEPTLGIDIQGKMSIWSTIKRFVLDNGCTVLLASNDMTEVKETCTRVGFLNSGRLLYTGNVDNLSEESVIRLRCTLGKELRPADLPAGDGVSIEPEGDNCVILTFAEYSEAVSAVIGHLSREYGVIALKEVRPSLTDLFDKYGRAAS